MNRNALTICLAFVLAAVAVIPATALQCGKWCMPEWSESRTPNSGCSLHCAAPAAGTSLVGACTCAHTAADGPPAAAMRDDQALIRVALERVSAGFDGLSAWLEDAPVALRLPPRFIPKDASGPRLMSLIGGWRK